MDMSKFSNIGMAYHSNAHFFFRSIYVPIFAVEACYWNIEKSGMKLKQHLLRVRTPDQFFSLLWIFDLSTWSCLVPSSCLAVMLCSVTVSENFESSRTEWLVKLTLFSLWAVSLFPLFLV